MAGVGGEGCKLYQGVAGHDGAVCGAVGMKAAEGRLEEGGARSGAVESHDAVLM